MAQKFWNELNRIRDYFYANPNIAEATTDNETPTPRTVYAALASQTLEGEMVCERMASQLIDKLQPEASAAVIYKTLLTIQYLVLYGHPDFHRILQTRSESIMIFLDYRNDRDDGPAKLIQEKAVSILEILKSNRPVPPSPITNPPTSPTPATTLSMLEDDNSTPLYYSDSTTIMESVSSTLKPSSWVLGPAVTESIWSALWSAGQSAASLISSSTSSSPPPPSNEPVSRYVPVSIGVYNPQIKINNESGNSTTTGFNQDSKPGVSEGLNLWRGLQNRQNTTSSPSNTGHPSSSHPPNHTTTTTSQIAFSSTPRNSISSMEHKTDDPIMASSILARYCKREYDSVIAICTPTGSSAQRPTRQQLQEFISLAEKSNNIGPIVLILIQQISHPNWIHKFRALCVIHELIVLNFPLVREYFSEEGTQFLKDLGESPQSSIREKTAQIIASLKEPPMNTVVETQNHNKGANNEIPNKCLEEETTGSLFDSLVLTDNSENNNNRNNKSSNQKNEKNSRYPLFSKIESETSQFDFIREEEKSENTITGDLLGSESTIITPVSLVGTPPPTKKVSPQEPSSPSLPSLPGLTPATITTSVHLPPSVSSALAQLPDATPDPVVISNNEKRPSNMFTTPTANDTTTLSSRVGLSFETPTSPRGNATPNNNTANGNYPPPFTGYPYVPYGYPMYYPGYPPPHPVNYPPGYPVAYPPNYPPVTGQFATPPLTNNTNTTSFPRQSENIFKF